MRVDEEAGCAAVDGGPSGGASGGTPASGGVGDAAAAEADGCDTVWVIGGATLYEQALDVASRAEVTVIDADVDGDTHAPPLDARWRRTAVDPAPDAWLDSASGPRHRFERWERD